ncbi:MAG: UDP-N-acetylmuramate--L-alanine ligase [Endomicrobium sp.]|jgi:UDP-N-acetylmuramate--alanine ligase|nr:UDP-N-acetylmuramate--L-alanine ligase [Endomicrobium sp.]
MLRRNQNIHFVGIGGAGMSGIAELLINLGYNVSGSDLRETDVTEHLKAIGAKIYIGHDSKNLKSIEIVVVSSAIDKDNPEVTTALNKKITLISRVEMLAELAKSKYTITVSGTHGKTTTTSLTSLILDAGGFNPTIVIGGKLKNFKSGAKLGNGNYIVVEADESDGSFLKLSPTIAIVTNIDDDHLDYYGDMENLKKAFINHINRIPFYGTAIICLDDENVRNIIPKISKKYISYGIVSKADINASNIKITKNYTSFDVTYIGKRIGNVCIKIPGEHNILNSLAAIGAGLCLGMPFNLIVKAINEFDGVNRRLEIKGEKKGVMVIDDYAHHPAEIMATLKAIKYFWSKRRIIVLFQPHRYTRTKQLFNKFGKSFLYADLVKVLDIYAAGEQKINGVTSDLIIKCLIKNKCKAEKFLGINTILKNIFPGDIILTLGAGDVWQKGEELLALI